MVYFKPNIFKLILKYCDNRLENNQKKYMSKCLHIFKLSYKMKINQ